MHATPGTLGRSIPFLDTMIRRDRALRFKTDPFEIFNSFKGQAIQYRLKCWRRGNGALRSENALAPKTGTEMPLFQHIGKAKADYCIVEAFAIAAKDRLDGEIQAALGAAGNLRAVTAFATLKPIGATHAWPVKAFQSQQTRFFSIHVWNNARLRVIR
jgi:hypothetical protein